MCGKDSFTAQTPICATLDLNWRWVQRDKAPASLTAATKPNLTCPGKTAVLSWEAQKSFLTDEPHALVHGRFVKDEPLLL